MNNLERQLKIVNTRMRMRFSESPLKPFRPSPEMSVLVRRDFIASKSEEIKLAPDNLVKFAEIASESPGKSINEIKNISTEEHVKDESYQPHKKMLDNLKFVNAVMRRFRRGSRCLAQPEHEPRDCEGRKHLKGRKIELSGSKVQETPPTNIIRKDEFSGSSKTGKKVANKLLRAA